MKFRQMAFFILLCALLQTIPAMASWEPFVSLGNNPVNSDLSCAPFTGGQAVCAGRSFTNTILVNVYNGAAWGTWKSLPGTVTSAPSCAPDGNGRMVCAARAPNGGMAYSVYDGAVWSKELKVKGSLGSGLSCATLGGGRVLCAARSSTGGLTSSVFNGTAWSAFDNQAATTTSAPACTSDGAGRVVCMMQDTASAEIANRYNGATWDGFINLGGLATGEPTCNDFGVAGAVVCFGRGTDTHPFVNLFPGGTWAAGTWSGWEFMGGGLVGTKTSCAAVAAAQLVCGVFGIPDSALWVDQFNGSSWTGFTRLGQTTIGNPSCLTLGGGKVLCAVVNVNNKVSSTVGP
jgi:hypothetical protein